ncbi:MAG: bifunctional diguanylate cyclase/phosphodiesterase [Arcobacteraceae bacterium]|jgi:diguanylate cyclase (GGDEF)-like protein|nr:bifunctional diguanylate cyclase/phosphodiesterase [Arcobacteraceae bacterium]
MAKQSTTYNKITAKIIFSMLFFTLLSSIIYSQYIKEEVILNLAKVDARKTSKLVFESMYSAMQKGWNKNEIAEIIERLNKVDDKLEISVYRGEKVASIYGDIEKDKEVRTKDANVQSAFSGKETLDIENVEIIKYYFPVIANDKCKACHTNVQVGDVLGVININYPITDLKVSLNDIINLFLFFIITFTFIMFTLLFINFNKYLLKPMQNFINTANLIKKSSDISQRVQVDHNINEIESMQEMFNGMLDSIEYQFYNDALTGLKNRRALLEDLDKHQNILFMIINIDKFQQINNLYGCEIGDKILLQFRDKFIEMLPKTTTLYKMHADEFSVISHGSVDLHEFENIASFIISHLGKYEFELDNGEKVFINLTIGISHGSSMLLPNADIALKLAKKDKKHFLTYNDDMLALKEYENRLNWTKRLMNAIDEDRIVPLFQPIVDCETDEIVRYEALMRIQESADDFIVPIHFLDISKDNKIYFKLTRIMLEKTFAIAKRTDAIFSINLTKDDMMNNEIVNFIVEEFKKEKFAHKISFEILESEGIENFAQIEQFILKVKEYGATISIDDFGTGYSNFEYLMKLNFDYLKIDASMIKNIDKDLKSQLVTKTIVEFSKKMGVKTIAEFVSSKAIYTKVQELGIDYAQGYYLGEPTILNI